MSSLHGVQLKAISSDGMVAAEMTP